MDIKYKSINDTGGDIVVQAIPYLKRHTTTYTKKKG